MNAQNNTVTILEMTVHPLNLICIHIGSIHLNGGRKIDNNRLLRSCHAPGLLNSSTYLQGIIQLCAGEALRRILQHQIAVIILRILFHQLCAFNGNLLNLFFIFVEDYISLQSRGGIVNMYHNFFDSLNCLKGSLDQMLTALYQNLHPDIIRNHPPLYQLTQKIILNLGSCRKSNLNLLESHLHQHIEEFHLLFHNHRLNQRLVSVS